ncbi:hypothetical protein WJX81_008398 [Elliptochloris bilobata]|uniref:RecA family profile 1 domain-containing protein n=1 Tax=Elliptochloris bilobata TaxID=381761 RepID=A0AAW1SJL1_9CHLO
MDIYEFAAWADETASQLLARSCCDPISTGVFFVGALRAGHVLEVNGPSGAAKSEILVQVAASCILPKDAGGVALGREENVVLLDLDAKFDELRLFQVLSMRLSEALQQSVEEVSEPARASLQRFHLVQCDSSFQLLATLRVLKPLLTKLQAGAGLQLLLIDNMSAYYWQDRAVFQAAAERMPQALTFSTVHTAVVAELRKLLLLRRLPGASGCGEARFAFRWLGAEGQPLAFAVTDGRVMRA